MLKMDRYGNFYTESIESENGKIYIDEIADDSGDPFVLSQNYTPTQIKNRLKLNQEKAKAKRKKAKENQAKQNFQAAYNQKVNALVQKLNNAKANHQYLENRLVNFQKERAINQGYQHDALPGVSGYGLTSDGSKPGYDIDYPRIVDVEKAGFGCPSNEMGDLNTYKFAEIQKDLGVTSIKPMIAPMTEYDVRRYGPVTGPMAPSELISVAEIPVKALPQPISNAPTAQTVTQPIATKKAGITPLLIGAAALFALFS